MGFLFRTIIFGLIRRFLGVPGIILIAGLLYFYIKSTG